ncbi:MAG TPA: potassium-transporting ATPase subunit C [Pseudonocardiaceae bacterium]|jgi:K+-transporting ATPase ATPase C chain|nr:potassium-transporting ATPase subunit C [Pseudonocardiaceae bacterium]
MKFSGLLRQTWAGLRVMIVLTILLGLIYPLAVWAVSRVPGLHNAAEGSIVTVNGQAVGSSLIGLNPVDPNAKNNPTDDRYFHTRASALATDYSSGDDLGLGANDDSSSLASNLGAANPTLVKQIASRKAFIAKREGVSPSQVPADAVTASGSGVDPDISPDYADLQIARVARVNGLTVAQVRQLVTENTEGRSLGFLGEPVVNVLDLNLAVRNAVGAR